MANKTQIANLALSWLGQNLINDLGDNQNEAKIMNANFDLSRDMVLGERAWTFALRQEILAPLAAAPAFGRGNEFQIPSDVIFVHRCYRPNNDSLGAISAAGPANVRALQNARWERIGDKILSTQDVIWASFVVRVTNTALFNSGFVHAFAARLAADTCMTLTENNKQQALMEELYTEKLAQAAYEDGRQGRTEIWNASLLTGVRTR